MGLRLNGVNNAEIKNVKIENIKSATKIGTTLGGKYENIVSQQAPYMNGYSMNMVNGMSLTFSKDISLNGITLNNIISNTGLSYGMAFWYETSVDIIDDGIDIQNVFAGKELPKSDRFSIDTYPNLRPQACGIRIYDDDTYKVVVNYGEEMSEDNAIRQQCIVGHTGCLFDDEIYSHLGDWDNFKGCEKSLILVKDAVDENGGEDIKKGRSTFSVEHKLGFVLILLLVIIAVIAMIYVCCNYVIDFWDKKTSIKYSELKPLLNLEKM